MGLKDQIAQLIAEGGGHPDGDRGTRWARICVCGHAEEYHGPAIGGTYGGKEWGHTSKGCMGAVPGRDHPRPGLTDDKLLDNVPTCPCPEFRPVAMIDRPGRYFRQRVWTRDRVHPMIRGLKAQHTRLANSKAYGDCADEEAERRLRWLDGARKCRVCDWTGDDVWPSYVNEGRLSQMRCEEHRRLPLAEAP